MKRSRNADMKNDNEPLLAAPEQAKRAPAAPSAREARTGTIEAVPVPREAIGLIAPKKYHAVDDKELEGLTRLEKPVSMAMAALFGGIFMGSVWTASSAAKHLLSGGQLSKPELAILIACAVSFGAALAAAFASAKKRSTLAGAVQTIRKRAKIYLPQGHPLAPN